MLSGGGAAGTGFADATFAQAASVSVSVSSVLVADVTHTTDDSSRRYIFKFSSAFSPGKIAWAAGDAPVDDTNTADCRTAVLGLELQPTPQALPAAIVIGRIRETKRSASVVTAFIALVPGLGLVRVPNSRRTEHLKSFVRAMERMMAEDLPVLALGEDVHLELCAWCWYPNRGSTPDPNGIARAAAMKSAFDMLLVTAAGTSTSHTVVCADAAVAAAAGAAAGANPAASTVELLVQAVRPAAQAVEFLLQAVDTAALAVEPAAHAVGPAAVELLAQAVGPAAHTVEPAAQAVGPAAQAVGPAAEATAVETGSSNSTEIAAFASGPSLTEPTSVPHWLFLRVTATDKTGGFGAVCLETRKLPISGLDVAWVYGRPPEDDTVNEELIDFCQRGVTTVAPVDGPMIILARFIGTGPPVFVAIAGSKLRLIQRSTPSDAQWADAYASALLRKVRFELKTSSWAVVLGTYLHLPNRGPGHRSADLTLMGVKEACLGRAQADSERVLRLTNTRRFGSILVSGHSVVAAVSGRFDAFTAASRDGGAVFLVGRTLGEAVAGQPRYPGRLVKLPASDVQAACTTAPGTSATSVFPKTATLRGVLHWIMGLLPDVPSGSVARLDLPDLSNMRKIPIACVRRALEFQCR